MKLLVALTAVAATVVAAASLQAGDEVFEHLAGEWRGGGEVRGMQSEQTMLWAPALDGGFMRLEFDNRMRRDNNSEFHFQAHAYYRAAPDGTVTGQWFDSRGVIFPLRGEHGPSRLSIEWGAPDTERGRSEYRVDGDRLEVVDEVLLPDGAWRVFGRSVLQRVR